MGAPDPRRPRGLSSGITVYHGTCATLATAIARVGLRTPSGPGVFVTTDMERAAGYAVRAVCVEMVERGIADRPDLAPDALLVTLRVGADSLTRDPAWEGDFVLRRAAPASIVENLSFDPREYLPDEAGVCEYAELTQLARSVEASWGEARLSAPPLEA